MCTIDKKRPTLTQPSELSILHSPWDSVSVSGMKLTLRYHNKTTHAELQATYLPILEKKAPNFLSLAGLPSFVAACKERWGMC